MLTYKSVKPCTKRFGCLTYLGFQTIIIKWRLLLTSFLDEEIFVQVYVKDGHTHTHTQQVTERGGV